MESVVTHYQTLIHGYIQNRMTIMVLRVNFGAFWSVFVFIIINWYIILQIQEVSPIVEMKIEKTKPVKDNIDKKKRQTEKQKVPNLRDLIKKNKNFQFLENGKLKCLLTNHEIPATLQAYQAYLKSKSYKRGLQSQFDISQYEEIIIQHKDNPRYFFCQLTGVKIPKKKSALEKHIHGKKFQRRLQQLKQEQQNGFEGQQQEFEQFEDEQEEQQQQEQQISVNTKNSKRK